MNKISLKSFTIVALATLFSLSSKGQTLQAVTEAGNTTSKDIFLLGTDNGLRLQNGPGTSFWVNTPGINHMAIGGTGVSAPASGAINITGIGYVGIGTSAPQSKLAVAGTITAQRVKVTTTGWPDFVFGNTYQLPTLQHIEKYILEHKHLPDMPSAEEVEKNGADLGEINKKLLQKIEELTLHLIQQQKEITALKERMEKIDAK